MDSIPGQFLDEEGMIKFVECFGLVQIDAISVIFSGSSLFEFDFYFVREGDETDNFTQYHLFHFTFSEYFKVALGITKDKEAKNRKGGAHLGFFFISLLRLGVLTALQ